MLRRLERISVRELDKTRDSIALYLASLRLADEAYPGMLSADGPMSQKDFMAAANMAARNLCMVFVVPGYSGDIAGSVCCEVVGHEDFLVSALFCLPAYRGQRIGTLLLYNALEFALECECARVHLDVADQNHYARSWYGDLGFVSAGEPGDGYEALMLDGKSDIRNALSRLDDQL